MVFPCIEGITILRIIKESFNVPFSSFFHEFFLAKTRKRIAESSERELDNIRLHQNYQL